MDLPTIFLFLASVFSNIGTYNFRKILRGWKWFRNLLKQVTANYKKKRCTIEITDSFFSPLHCNEGIHEAINGGYLDSYNLSLLNPYMVLSNFPQRFESFRVCGMKLNTWPRLCIMQPNLSASWLFQRAMSAKKQSNVPVDFINELLYTNFSCMQVVFLSWLRLFWCFFLLLLLFYPSFLQRLGDPVLRPFLQVYFCRGLVIQSEILDMFFLCLL